MMAVAEGEQKNGSPKSGEIANPMDLETGSKELPRSRTIVKQIVLKDFKSYAGVVVIGPFHKSFSSIVGPNGSGKSNVIDSLLFVFGFRAKKLRQEKLSHLIHKSSEDIVPKSCWVEVHFVSIVDDPDDQNYTYVPGSEVIIKRSVEKPMERGREVSCYYINGKIESYSNITKFLLEKGIDLNHKRFLILQGEVESISLMKPKSTSENDEGLLEYLEDIIGTSHYNETINNMSEKLEAIESRRDQMIMKLRIAEIERDALESKSKKAFEYINLCNSLTIKKYELFSITSIDCDEKIEMCNEKLASENTLLQKLNEKQSLLISEEDKLKKELLTHQGDLKSLTEERDSKSKEIQEYEFYEIQTKETLNHMEKKKARFKNDIKNSEKVISECKTWLKNFDKVKKDAEDLISTLNKKRDVQTAAFEDVKREHQKRTKHIQDEIDSVHSELSPWVKEMDSKQADYDIVRSEIKMLEERLRFSDTAIRDAKKRLSSTISESKSKKIEAEDLRDKLEKSMSLINKKNTELEILYSSRDQVRNRIKSLNAQLVESFNVHQDTQVRRGLSCLLEQSKLGNIKGICGRLGDIGSIDSIYDTAITTACSSLNHIVVESVQTAQTCINFLRQNSLGRATFICLDKLKTMDMEVKPTPENVPRLFDLVQFRHPRYKPAFYHALRDTLVCENMDQAVRIAYGKRRYRVVTVEGQLLDITGTMSGCGKKQKGGMSLKSRDNDNPTGANQDEISREIRQLEEKLSNTNSSIDRLREEIEHETSQCSSSNFRISKLNMEIKALDADISDSEVYIKSLESNMKSRVPDGQHLEQLRMKSKNISEELERLKSKVEDYQEKVSVLLKKSDEAGGADVSKCKNNLDETIKELNDAEAALLKLSVEHKIKESSIEREAKATTEYKTELNECEEKIADVSLGLKKKVPHMESLKKGLETTNKVLKELQVSFDNLNSSLSKIIEQNQENSQKILEKKALLDRIKDKISVYEKRRQHYKNDISLLKLISPNPDEEIPLPEYKKEQLLSIDTDKLQSEITNLDELTKKDIPNLNVLVEHEKKCKLHASRAEQLERVSEERDSILEEYDTLRKERLDKFMEGFVTITKYLKEIYQTITMGGNAELEAVDSLNPFSEGIVFSVMPPRKSWKNICNLSGGEKTLSSLALVFALHRYKPTNLYFMDEIDAALDFRNVSIIANYIKERTKNAQFIVISLRNNMFEVSNRLVGIYKVNNQAKSITINPKKIVYNHMVKV